MKVGYCDPTSWYCNLLASHGHMIQAQPPSKEHQKAEDPEDLVASLDLPAAESPQDRKNFITTTTTVTSLAALLLA